MCDKKLEDLLANWNLTMLLERFQDESIGVEELLMMKPHHVKELLQSYNLGVRIRFEHHFELWRSSMSQPLAGLATAHNQNVDVGNNKDKTMKADTEIKEYSAKNKNISKNAMNTAVVFARALKTRETLTNDCSRNPESMQLAAAYENYSYDQPSANSSLQKFQQETLSACVENISLLDILKLSGKRGDRVLDYYKEHQDLTDSHRRLLIGIISNYFECNGFHLSLQRSYDLEEQILKLFPTEQLQTYRTEKRGKIYVKFGNMKRQRRRSFKQYIREDENNKKRSRLFSNDSISASAISTAEDNCIVAFENSCEEEEVLISPFISIKTESLDSSDL